MSQDSVFGLTWTMTHGKPEDTTTPVGKEPAGVVVSECRIRTLSAYLLVTGHP